MPVLHSDFRSWPHPHWCHLCFVCHTSFQLLSLVYKLPTFHIWLANLCSFDTAVNLLNRMLVFSSFPVSHCSQCIIFVLDFWTLPLPTSCLHSLTASLCTTTIWIKDRLVLYIYCLFFAYKETATLLRYSWFCTYNFCLICCMVNLN